MRLYFHIPFCHQKCSYCDFYFTTQTRHQDRFADALIKELEQREHEWKKSGIKSIYFGGGTPSLINSDHIEKILNHISRHARIVPNAEITLEANPEDITPGNLQAWKSAGVNRLSIGIQSFDDQILKLLHRNHDASKALKSIEQARKSGFYNLNIDLIFGIPGLNIQTWEKQLNLFLKLDIPHLSAYALSIENKTLLQYQIRKNILKMTPDECYEKQFYLTRQMLLASGYEHYEISNYAKPGFHAQHNSAYWQGEAYIGFGPAAHSFDGNRTRSFNPPNIHAYMKAMEENRPFQQKEILTDKDLYNEFVLTRLRHLESGITEMEVAKRFPAFFDHFIRQAKKMQAQGKMQKQKDRWYLTEAALFISDNVIAELFY